MIVGCTKTLETPKEPVVDASLPQVDALRTLSGATEVGFEWTPIYDERVDGYYLYRMSGNQPKRIATIKDKYSSHYVDTKLAPNSTYSYRMSTYSSDKYESGLSPIASATTTAPVAKTATLGQVEPISFIKAISDLPARIKIIWRPHSLENVEAYIVERNEYKSTSWEEVAKVKGRLSAEYIDKDIRDNYVYRYRIKVITVDGVVSKPSDTVEARSKPLPHAIVGVKATGDLPKKIVLTWNPSDANDFAYYKIYRSPTSSLLYSFHGKTANTEFEDLISDNGKTYYYKVTAVTKDGLESRQQDNPIAGMSMPALAAPVVTSVRHDGRTIYLSWNGDRNTVKYTITKEFKSAGSNKKQSFTGIFESTYQDSDTMPGVEYTYHVIAIDKYGIASDPSDSVIITVPKE